MYLLQDLKRLESTCLTEQTAEQYFVPQSVKLLNQSLGSAYL